MSGMKSEVRWHLGSGMHILKENGCANSKGMMMYRCAVGRMRSQREHAGDTHSMFAYSYSLACVLVYMFRVT